MTVNTSIFWDINRPLSYNALFNFIVGNRGGGKTYGAKKYVIKKFIQTRKQFVYVRRYEKEFKRLKKFFDDIRDEFPDHELTVKGKEFYIDGELAGYAIVLSTSKIEKSNPMPEVDTIIFDEFVIDKGIYRYIPDEVTNFLELYETVARLRDVKVFFLSNAITMINPYFLYFDLKIPYKKDIQCKNDILIQIYCNEEFLKVKKNTRFGKIIDGTPYGAYNMENKFLRDIPTFIEKKSGQCNFQFSFIYKSEVFGIWRNNKEGKIYVSKDYDHNRPIYYALTKEDHTPNTLLLSGLRSSPPFHKFLIQFEKGNVYFENQRLKNLMWDVVKLAHIY